MASGAARSDRIGPDNYLVRGLAPDPARPRRRGCRWHVRAGVRCVELPLSQELPPLVRTQQQYLPRAHRPAAPGLAIQLPSNAVGKDFLPDGVYSPPHPAGPGFNYRFVGFGILLAAREGLEVNLLGLSLGVDPVKPALKLPALGRLGIAGL